MFYNGVGTSNTFEPFAHIGGKQNDLKVGAVAVTQAATVSTLLLDSAISAGLLLAMIH